MGLSRHTGKHVMRMSATSEYGHITIQPPLSEAEFSIAAQALRIPYGTRSFEQSLTEEGSATEFKILVDSDRHLYGRANNVQVNLEKAGVEVELEEAIAHVY